ncbi:sulfite reductase subunit alpha [Methylovorus sp. MM2]|uniref:sulfite reductase subunit alpha n=1 Tax=Methylovorus sp. MM2 TaxID=1848038 RepID=UPI0007DF8173|nr:sulfite reductase subunit alpha [Methylovorus sp. MM2]OAM51595.1 sulfite reductase subunit alpha [Methylovorus sp. MM2]
MKYLAVVAGLLISNFSYAGSIGAGSIGISHTANAIIVIALYLIFCGWVIWRYKKRTAKTLLDKNRVNSDTNMRDENSILVAYASQTGNAEQLAQKTADSLNAAGLAVEIHLLSVIDAKMLHSFTRALFVVSTTGEGDAPDNASDFLRKGMHQDTNLAHLNYAILALGDASYTYFCGFGHTLDAWLQHTHATPLFDIVEVDRNNDGALRHWQYQLSVLAKDTEMADWKTPDYQQWKLTDRTLLNKGSVGAPVYHLRFSTQKHGTRWQAGDIAEVGPRNSSKSVNMFLNYLGVDGSVQIESGGMTFYEGLLDKLLPHDEIGFKGLADLDADAILSTLNILPHREYSIASIPQDGGLELVVRQTHYADGRLGIGSGWLTEYAAMDSDIALRIRENTAFHPPLNDIPLILIGNGTGIAGLRAHLKMRVASGRGDNWLIFGERNAEHDFYFKDELSTWRDQGVLTRLETAFSRDQAERIYVQDVLKSVAPDIVKWVEIGAAIYVCGSASGMAPAVHNELLEILGEATLSTLTASGRYRRDVY